MIVCTRCAAPNDDETRFCVICGHKLQSGRSSLDEGLPRPKGPLTPGLGMDGAWYRRMLLRAIEIWGVIVVLGAAVGYGLFTRVWWPSWAAGGLAAAVVALRRR